MGKTGFRLSALFCAAFVLMPMACASVEEWWDLSEGDPAVIAEEQAAQAEETRQAEDLAEEAHQAEEALLAGEAQQAEESLLAEEALQVEEFLLAGEVWQAEEALLAEAAQQQQAPAAPAQPPQPTQQNAQPAQPARQEPAPVEIAAPARPAATPPARVRQGPVSFYTVRRGDTLWSIAADPRVYNDPSQWPRLFISNRRRLTDPNNPNLIEPGQVLEIPRSGNSRD